MDLGCLDLGCIDKHTDTVKDAGGGGGGDVTDPDPKSSSSSSSSKNKSLRDSLTKFTSQIKKPPRRKSSPINWFPRKKMDSYLKRKIKMLQDVSGMNLTLDETLDDTNPHYSRVLREKIAAREAAHKAMEARKAALVEASWCRILHAAGIQSREAENELSKAEKAAAEAFEAARAIGVIMYDQPSFPKKTCEVKAYSVNETGGGSTTHTVTASFETAFEVDKEVASAVKMAFIRLSNCPSFRKDEFKDLLWKISQNPDTGDDNPDLVGSSSEIELESSESEFDTMSHSEDLTFKALPPTGIIKLKSRQSLEKLTMEKLIDMMVERLKCLDEDELSSIATIVATCGLNAALAQVESNKLQDPFAPAPRRISSFGSSIKENSNLEESLDGTAVKRNNLETEAIPDLGSMLIKHTSRLQKEIEEAKKNHGKEFENIKKSGNKVSCHMNEDVSEIPSLDKFLAKDTSRLQKEIEEAKKNRGKEYENIKKLESKVPRHMKEDASEIPSLDKFLVKHVSRLEKEVQEARNSRKNDLVNEQKVANLKKKVDSSNKSFSYNHGLTGKENLDSNNNTDCESLDKVLVKHVSRLEKEKMNANASEQVIIKAKASGQRIMNEEESLEQILVKHDKPKLGMEKIMAAPTEKQEEDQSRIYVSRREARNRELQEAWGGLSLGNSIKPHVSKLEREKAAWTKAEEEERKGGSARED
ncbi:hypothetical protein ACFE04_021958 [Oxalis oulophora]